MTTQLSDLLRARHLAQAGKIEEAVKILEGFVERYPKDFDGLYLLGTLYAIRGVHESAVKLFLRAYQIRKSNPELLFNLGTGLFHLKQFSQAIQILKQGTKVSPRNKDIWLNLGRSFYEAQDYTSAKFCFNKCLSIDSDDPRADLNLGLCLYQEGQYQESADLFSLLTRKHPNFSEAWANFAVSLIKLGNHVAALECCDTAIRINPELANAWFGKGVCLEAFGRLNEAIDAYQRTLTLSPDHVEAAYNLCLLSLSQKKFELGWPLYHARWLIPSCSSTHLHTSKPKWNGIEKINGVLFVWAEQGIGDQILFLSSLEHLLGLIKKIIVSVDVRLIALLRRSFPEVEFVSASFPLEETRFDFHIPMGDLPSIFFKREDSFLGFQRRALSDDRDLTEKYRVALKRAAQFPICGLSWRSGNKLVGQYKSVNLDFLVRKISDKNLSFVNLQYDTSDEDLRGLAGLKQLLPPVLFDLTNDLDGFASLVKACDFVLTTSNSTAHFAGALGVPTYLLIPNLRGAFWYWHESGGRNLWYPSVRVFRQSIDGDWDTAITPALAEIESFLRSISPGH